MIIHQIIAINYLPKDQKNDARVHKYTPQNQTSRCAEYIHLSSLAINFGSSNQPNDLTNRNEY